MPGCGGQLGMRDPELLLPLPLLASSDTMRWSGLTEHLSGVFVYGFILKELFFSLEPVVQFRTGLITSPDVEFVCPLPDLFFE